MLLCSGWMVSSARTRSLCKCKMTVVGVWSGRRGEVRGPVDLMVLGD